MDLALIKRIRCFALGPMLVLQACAWAPGSNIKVSDDFFQQTDAVWFPGIFEEQREPAQEEVDEFTIVPITPQLLAEQTHLTQGASSAVAAAMPAELLQEIADYEYEISNGDILNVTVYDHPELTIPAGSQRSAEESGNTVENDGTLFYPYIGKVHVAGRSVDQVREIIAERLAEFITAPQVAVRVVRFNAKRVYLTGRVNNPGPQPITNVPLTVLDAIAQAGGLSENANWHEVMLSRNGQDISLSVYEMLNNGRLGQNMLLQHGDVLYVPDIGEQKVFVLGELNRVNTIPMGNLRMSLTEALTVSGGLNQTTSNARGIFVIRQTSRGSEGGVQENPITVYQLDVRNAINFVIGTRFMLQPTDIVYVTTAPVTRWNRVISQIMPSVTALLTVERLAN